MNRLERHHLRQRLDKVLETACKKARNGKHEQSVVTEYDPHPIAELVVLERNALFEAITNERAKLGKDPISMKSLVRCENQAFGHVDYFNKYVLYATELVLDESKF